MDSPIGPVIETTDAPSRTVTRLYDWAELSNRVLFNIKSFGNPSDPIYGVFYHYKGADYIVDYGYLMEQKDSNRTAELDPGSGEVSFDCESSDLRELVVQLVKDRYAEEMLERSKGKPAYRPARDHASAAHPPEIPYRPSYSPTPEDIARSKRQSAEAESRPRSRWTKADIIALCRDARMPRKSVEAVRRMTLDQIFRTCMAYDCTEITGNEYNDCQQRHTKFYRIDFAEVELLAVVESTI